MADARTNATEMATALGMLDFDRLDSAAAGPCPSELVNITPTAWEGLQSALGMPANHQAASAAFANGQSFVAAADGLRGRFPARIEWKGPDRPPGYDLVPADLRVDHVYLISCKYQSQLLMNASPAHLFDRRLQVRTGARAVDWYEVVAGPAYAEFYEVVRQNVDGPLPACLEQLSAEDRLQIKGAGTRRWPASIEPAYLRFCAAVSEATARRWSQSLPKLADREQVLWRMLRLTDCPYFVLGTSGPRTLRLRIGTPWDWRQHFRLKGFDIEAVPSGQPRVEWTADIDHLAGGESRTVRGHVEIRWSHGRFCGMPEAKIYLDTPHHQVPGYFPLEPEPYREQRLTLPAVASQGPRPTVVSHRRSMVAPATTAMSLWPAESEDG